jgi:hypothetical protein
MRGNRILALCGSPLDRFRWRVNPRYDLSGAVVRYQAGD